MWALNISLSLLCGQLWVPGDRERDEEGGPGNSSYLQLWAEVRLYVAIEGKQLDERCDLVPSANSLMNFIKCLSDAIAIIMKASFP